LLATLLALAAGGCTSLLGLTGIEGADAGDAALAPGSDAGNLDGTMLEGSVEGNFESGSFDALADATSDTKGDGNPCSVGDGNGAVGLLGCSCSKAGELACNGNAQKLSLVCSGGLWTFLTACQPGFNCNTTKGANQGLCEAIDPLCASAKPGQVVCNGVTQVLTCGDDLLASEDTAGASCVNQTCQQGKCTGSCTAGASQCSADQPQQCSAVGVWENTGTMCPYACTGGTGVGDGGTGGSATCTGVCTPGAVQCNGQQPQICDATGTWQSNGAVCPNVCTSGACAGSCAPGATQCTNGGVETCSASGQWGALVGCPYVCLSGACSGVCTPGAAQCSGNGVRTCGANGQWGAVSACGGSLPVCVNAACAACTPGTRQCSANGVETCNASGKWSSPAACVNMTCVAGACTGVCAPNATQCAGNGVESCDGSGHWSNPSACNGQACVGGACVGVCMPGAKQCSGQQPQTCDANGSWQNTGATCPYVCGAGVCSGTCTPGAMQCSGEQPQTCSSAGTWTATGPPCPDVCSAGACTGSCPPGSTQCSGNGAETCSSSGTWGILGLPRFRRQFLYAASLFDLDLSSNAIGLT
jgi:hypothetical protein